MPVAFQGQEAANEVKTTGSKLENETVQPTPIIVELPSPKIRPKRIVNREGIVKRTRSIQAPTKFGLQSLDSGKIINYLNDNNLPEKLQKWKNAKILVSGEEWVDERWKHTPILEVTKLRLLP